ncbi:calcium-activated chloride channel regulator 1-like [Elgaria multicarinata webbii]|uniref:calcium-activated chloride channel regulator 1-like n=1 Tax=Elgaria multicarinata webbii TaxID=159646 RepID=UPI002FCCD410
MAFNRWLLLMVLVILHGVTSTMIKLNNGGFEDIVVAINPAVPENDKIIDNLESMVKEASAYLFSATKQRFYLKTVKVIIPLTWASKSEYQRVTTESYEKADVIVAEPYLKYGDDPYVLQYGACGEKGRYIHFTPNFLTKDNLFQVYGPRGRVFVHEWAHLRWGVFDEYNSDAPFYNVGNNNAEATRCSADITGRYIFRTSTGKYRPCRFEGQTKEYEAGCQFVPNRKQSAPVSIMYMQNLPSVTQFCDKNNHNIYATNMQNKKCNYRSTWEVIMNSTDYVNSSPLSAPPPEPVFSFLQTQARVVCLVLDVSGSMGGHNRIARLKQAAELFLLQVIETGSWVGVVTFNNAAITKTALQQINSDVERQTLSGYLPTIADGGTNICAGIHQGFQVFRQKYSSTKGCEIVLLTDGEDSSVGSCFGEVKSSGSIIHTIALGPSAAKELEELSDMTGGLKLLASDNLDSNSLIDAFSGILSGSGDIIQQSIQLESKGETINPNQRLDGTVTIDSTVGNDTFFVVTWNVNTYPPNIQLTDPNGKIYSQTHFAIDKTNQQTARLKIDGTAEAGDWTYSILNTYSAAQVLSVTVTTRAASANVPPVTVKTYMNTDANIFPSPIVIYAEVSQGFLPVTGANVTATIESVSGKSIELQLLDDGSGADILKNDGIYSRYFISFEANGRYNTKVRVQGKDETVRRVRRQNQVLYVPGYIEDGEIKMNPPRPEHSEDDIKAKLGKFSRTAPGGSFVMSGVPPGDPRDVFPPCKITDLEIELKSEEFLLSWTAPGNDYDTGKAERYELKRSDNPLDLRDATFHNALSVNTSGLTTEPAGVKQLFQYKPENFTGEKGTTIFFAMRAIDDSNNVGEASNIAKVVVLTPDNGNTNTMFNSVTIILLTVCAAVIVLL